MAKKITLTEDHIRLIQNLKFEDFEYGHFFSLENVNMALELINGSDKNLDWLKSYLYDLREQLETISERKECHAWGINQWSLWGGTYVMEDIAMILGHYDEYIPGTEESPLGKQYPKELEDYWWVLYNDIANNLSDIINLVFYYTDKGGLTPGEYIYKNSTGIRKELKFS